MIFTDQLGRKIELADTPVRVICLVPSITELLFHLGLQEEVVGITKFCIHPDSWFRTKTRVGGTKQINSDIVRSLAPDLVIANKEENTKEMIEELETFTQVWISDVSDLSEAEEMILGLGEILGKSSEAKRIVEEITFEFNKLIPLSERKTVKYYIWKLPDLMVGKRTFIDDMLTKCGFINGVEAERYPEDDGEIVPDLILLSSEPYPFKESDFDYFQQRYPGADIQIVDGEMFSWYGSHLLKSPEYFRKVLNLISE